MNLKIATYNINHGFRLKKVIENVSYLASSGVNLFCLQEVRPTRSRGFIGDLLLEKLGPAWQGEFFLTQIDNSDYGLAILWNSDQIQSIKFETLSLSKLASLHLHESALELVRGHGPGPIQRGAQIGTFLVEGKEIRITNVHLDWQGWVEHRTKQLGEVLGYLKQNPSKTEILCGDFNTIGFFGYGHRIEKINELLQKEFISALPLFSKTTTHHQHLDHIFIRNIVVKNAEVIKLPGSDHYPLVAQLEI